MNNAGTAFPGPRKSRTAIQCLFAIVVVLTTIPLGSCVSRVSYRELAQEYYNLGNAFFDLGDFERSFQYYRRAVGLDSTLPATGYNLSRLHVQRGEYDEALEVLGTLLEADPENGLYLETVAYIHFQAGQYDLARSNYTTLIELFPGRPRLRYNLALLELDQGRPNVAAEVLLGGIDTAQDDGEYHWLLAEAAYEDNDLELAEMILDRYRTLMGNDEEALVKLARRYAAWDYPLAALDVLASVSQTVNNDPSLIFLESRLVLTAASDFDSGLDRLRDALDAGFEAEKELVALLGDLRPGDREIVRAVIEERGFLLNDGDDSYAAEED